MDKRIIAVFLIGFALWYFVNAEKKHRDAKKEGQAESLTELFAEPGPSLKEQVKPVTAAVRGSAYAEDLAYFYRRMALIIEEQATTTTQARNLNETMGEMLNSTSPWTAHHPKLEPVVEELFAERVGKKPRKLDAEDRKQIADLFMAIAWACLEAAGGEAIDDSALISPSGEFMVAKFNGVWQVRATETQEPEIPGYLKNGLCPLPDNYDPSDLPTIDELIEQRDSTRFYQPVMGQASPRGPPQEDDAAGPTGLKFDEAEYLDYLKNKKTFFSDLGFRGTGIGETRLLYRAVLALDPESYTEAQETGDCTSHGCRNAADASRAYEIMVLGEPESWVARGATEPIYGYRGTSQQGMTVYRAVKFVNETAGLPVRKRYGQIDLRKYNAQIGMDWGSSGVPGDLTRELANNPVQHAALIRNVEEARDAIYNGFGLVVGSDVGFNSKRDQYGFAIPKGRWMHCMAWVGVAPERDLVAGSESNDPCFLVVNSWGTWNGGPEGKYDIPEGAFWITKEVAENMIGQKQAFAVGNFRGFEPKPITNWGFGYLSVKPGGPNDRLPAKATGMLEGAVANELYKRNDITKPVGPDGDGGGSGPDGIDDHCDICNGKGYIEHGDGHRSECPNERCPYIRAGQQEENDEKRNDIDDRRGDIRRGVLRQRVRAGADISGNGIGVAVRQREQFSVGA